MNTLYRVFVSLPTFMCERERPWQERTVFFEAPYNYANGSNAGAAEVLEKLLTLAWGTDATGWCEQGYAYNMRRERELLDDAIGEGDARLLEISWGGPERIGHAKSEDVDLFVSPPQAARLRAALQATERKAVARAHDTGTAQTFEDGMFTRFWSRYPRKDGELSARAAWSRLNTDSTGADALDSALSEAIQSATWTAQGGMFIPLASAWLKRQADVGECLNRRRQIPATETQSLSAHRKGKSTPPSRPLGPRRSPAECWSGLCAVSHESASPPPAERPAQNALRRFESSLSSGTPEKAEERSSRASLEPVASRSALAHLLDVLDRMALPDESARPSEAEDQHALHAARQVAAGASE